MKKDTGTMRHPWMGKKTELLTIRVTAMEKAELAKAAQDSGGVGVSRYLLNLHHREVRNLK